MRRPRPRAVVTVVAAALMSLTVAQSAALAAPPAAAARVGSPGAAAVAGAAAADPSPTGDIQFSVPSGTFTGQLSLTLATSLSGAEIRYTTDGTVPTASSTRYSGTALTITRTTQVRAQAFSGGAATGAPGSAVYVARSASVTTAHDLPVVVMDAYGKGKPTQTAYSDVAYLEMRPSGGTTTVSAAPTLSSRAAFKLHGQSSQMFSKVPYRLELRGNDDKDADLPVLGLPADSDWVLRGPFSDKTLIRDAFVYGLGRDMGLQAPRFAFFELYLNLDAQPVGADDYQGVYMMVEKIKNSKQRLNLKKLKAEDTTEPAITGGYIFKFEWMATEEPTIPCSGANCWNYLELVDPGEPNSQQKAWLQQYLQQFNQVLHSSNFADPNTGYRAYIDVGSWIDQMIIYELTRNLDAYVRSAYFYKDRGGKISAGPLWDYDLIFGVGSTTTGGWGGTPSLDNLSTSGWAYQQSRNPNPNDWFPTLMKDPAFVNQVKARWQELRKGILSDSQLVARMNSLSAPLANGASRNFAKWPNLTTSLIGPFTTPTASSWQGQLQAMQSWMTQRTAWLDSTNGWGGSVTPTPTPTPTPTSTSPTPTPTSTSPTPTPTPTSTSTSPTPTPTPTPTSTSPTPTPTVGGKGCTASYKVTSSWQNGFQGEVAVTAGNSAISGWRVTWTMPSGSGITQSWNATLTTSGSSVNATNLSWNGSLAASASTTFGFVGSGSSASIPAVTCTAS